MTRWEYAVLYPIAPGATEVKANELGADGWEIVRIENGIWYFKRKIQDYVPTAITLEPDDSSGSVPERLLKRSRERRVRLQSVEEKLRHRKD